MSGDDIRFRPIGRIYTDFPTKFGLPRQSAPGSALTGRVVFEPEYRVREAFRGLESVTHIWLLWLFSAPPHGDWSPTVRPPRLGGNRRMGVFATRSPNRPNPIGLTCVKLEAVEPDTRDGPVLYVSGVDMQSGTPLLDVKPYLPYADARPDACGGFGETVKDKRLTVDFPPALLARLAPDKRAGAAELLAQDPRPGYHADPARVYRIAYAGKDMHFTVADGVLTVTDVTEINNDR
ncbi:MAG: tRNA (N6-threonylcarbamoyladenosine(37)-N6)-methyltransferase TrmO [Candidatus Woodwardiibium sp.]